jgi:hypothetical protein
MRESETQMSDKSFAMQRTHDRWRAKGKVVTLWGQPIAGMDREELFEVIGCLVEQIETRQEFYEIDKSIRQTIRKLT